MASLSKATRNQEVFLEAAYPVSLLPFWHTCSIGGDVLCKKSLLHILQLTVSQKLSEKLVTATYQLLEKSLYMNVAEASVIRDQKNGMETL